MGVFVIVFGDSGFENSLGVSVRASSFFSLNVKWKLNVYGDTCLQLKIHIYSQKK